MYPLFNKLLAVIPSATSVAKTECDLNTRHNDTSEQPA
jgi:hypothetical protein